jgi:endonuclease/exonuclease/phosphatase (EEP) superfamily protein YafD
MTMPSFWRLLWLSGFFICTFTLLGLFARWYWFFELFVHFSLQYGVILLLLSIVAQIKKQKIYVVIFFAFGLVNMIPVLASLKASSPIPAANHIKLRMLSINVRSVNTQHKRLINYIKGIKPDIVLLVETNWHWDENLDDIKALYPHSLVRPRWDSYGISFYSRYPLTRKEVLYLDDVPLPTLHVTAKINGTAVNIYGVHFAPPISPGSASYRNRQMKGLVKLLQKKNENIIVAGDMNTTPWSPHFKDLVSGGNIKNSMDGNGLGISWPSFFPPLGIAIDHVLVSKNIIVQHRQIGRNIGSDHLPVLVDIMIPR